MTFRNKFWLIGLFCRTKQNWAMHSFCLSVYILTYHFVLFTANYFIFTLLFHDFTIADLFLEIKIRVTRIEPPHDKTNKIACAPSEDSDQPGLI